MIHSTTIHTAASPREAEYLAGWQRSRAELANLRARLEQERSNQRQAVTRDVVESFLSLADNFTALTNHTPPELQDNAWTQGVLHVARQFGTVLESHGITPINPQGLQFDPHTHEAVEQVQVEREGKDGGKAPTDQVVEVIQVGYRLGDQLIRPAKVKVAK